ncbi:MAG: hypothetical protein ACREHD_25200 [Pirellulales bacterium]
MAIGPSKPVIRTLVAGTALSLVGVAGWWLWFAAPPQLGGDEKVFEAVDALFTAVRAHDERLLADCEQRLRSYQQDGALTPAAGNFLDDVIQMARAGQWRPAAEKLYTFMRAQRRK